MSRPKSDHTPPTRHGVSPSTVALPSGSWATVLDFLSERIPAVSRADWAQRMSQGEVRKIDAARQKITLRHGPIANIGMPPMTMVFDVKDATLLEGVAVGDKVGFVVEQQGSKFVVTELQGAQ